MEFLPLFLVSILALATPLLLAALGELLGEKTGVLNISLEAMMLCGALACVLGAWKGGALVGILAGLVAGIFVAAIFGVLVLNFRADAIVTGTGLNLFALGATGTLSRSFPEAKTATVAPLPFAILALALVPLLAYFLRATRPGLAWRASGEAPQAALAMGVSIAKTRWLATLLNGALCGLGGAALLLLGTGSFGENMTAGRGFIALAVVVFGRYSPFGALLGALLLAFADGAQIALQSRFPAPLYPLFLALPYVFTLVTLATVKAKSKAPAALGQT